MRGADNVYNPALLIALPTAVVLAVAVAVAARGLCAPVPVLV